MKEQRVLAEIRAARDHVAEAEGDIAALLGEIRGALRAEKVAVSETLQRAFDKLRAGREHLETLEKLAREPEE